ncbi:hypothetical protein ASD11_00115 [Aeromicrobium sp. Root495]|uniref:type II secretion system F family protein n=1 Tax=Aeromicrobium sp. Root495 TaxID=1736550 RepID=UPI0006FCDCAE|nr:type II secretion system F family protein [Aeromicrobium sp. Root495]KQY58117.1 hypothetical protein ASD11_00115 [Aeromicrobium sp. Root495]RYJ05203.1 MAG: type II secretion system protein [Actinomycetales bacterium]
MIVVSALSAAAGVWLLVPGSSAGRARRRFAEERASAAARPWLGVVMALPVLCILVLGPVAGLLTSLGVLLVGRRWRAAAEPAAQRRRRQRVGAQLPRALDLVVAALEAGRPPGAALSMVAAVVEAPLAEELEGVAARLRVASDPRAVWDDLASDPVLGPTGRAFRRAETSGMPVARVVHEVAVEQRRVHQGERRERGRRVAVKTAAPLGLCFLPAFFLVGVVPTVMGVLAGLDLGLG